MPGVTLESCRRVVLVLALGALFLALAACGSGPDDAAPPEEEGAPVHGGTLVLGSISDVDNWNPYLSRQNFAVGLLSRVYLPLARETGDQTDGPPAFAPALAENWTVSDDGRELTFTLREASWSDGAPVTSGDVVFTWRAQVSPEVAWIGSASKSHIVEVTAPDPRTVVFRFDRTYPDALADAVAGSILPAHVFGEIPFDTWRTHDWSVYRVGSGPFLPEAHRPGTEAVLARNPTYAADSAPYPDRVVARIVPDAGNLLTQVLSGALDYMEGVPPRDADRVRAAQGYTLFPIDWPGYDFIGWNASRPPFDDPEVRRALTLAIDRKAIVEELLYGFGRVSAGPVPSFWWAADRTLQPWPNDPAEARRILESRGFEPRETDGTLARDGEVLQFDLTTNAGNRLRGDVMVKVQEQLRRIGIPVGVQPMEMRAWRQKVAGGDYDAFLGGWVLSGKVEIESLFGESGSMNVVSYRSEELETLLSGLGEASDWAAKKPVLDEIQARIHADQPYTFLYEAQRLAVAGPRLRNVRIETPSDTLAFLEDAWIVEP